MAMTLAKFCLKGSLRRYLNRSFTTDAKHYSPVKGDRVVLAMSGGVDSSVTAKLLADQDFDLSAIFMRNWDTRDESGTDMGCEWEKDWEDVQRVCRALDLPCEMIDLSREYWNRVFEPSLKLWESGITPNPDVWCNKEIKFGALIDRLPLNPVVPARSWFATGHYARKSWSTPTSQRESRPKLLRATDRNKDQSYYLSSISEKGLARALFPIGHMTKPDIRELAKKHRLPTAEREESMGLCFIGEKTKFNRFISQYISPNPGTIVKLTTGDVIGKHSGLWNYTIGERIRMGGMPEKMYVAQKDIATNQILVVPGTNHEALYCNILHATEWNWIWADSPPVGINRKEGFRARVTFRYRMSDIPCTVRKGQAGDTVITFDEPQKSAAPGQVVTLWDGDWCLGCGIIKAASSTVIPIIIKSGTDTPVELDASKD